MNLNSPNEADHASWPVLAVDVGGTAIRAAVVGPGAEILSRRRVATRGDLGAEMVLEDLFAIADGVIAETGTPPRAVGVSFGGPVDYRNQRIRKSQHVHGWDRVDLCARFTERYHVPTVMDNDANVVALGEWRRGAGIQTDDLIYLTVSTGVGGGIIAGGSVLRGRNGLAGEIGHITVEPGGRPCPCGKRGCVEAYASGSSIAAMACELVAHDRVRGARISEAAEHGGTIDARAVYRAAASGDPSAAGIIEASIHALAVGIAAAVSMTDPEMVVIGGGVTKEGDRFFKPLRREVARLSSQDPSLATPIIPAALGDDGGLIGAGLLASIP